MVSADGYSLHKKNSLPVKKEYSRCANILHPTGLLVQLPISSQPGVVASIPMPTLKQVKTLFVQNQALINNKI